MKPSHFRHLFITIFCLLTLNILLSCTKHKENTILVGAILPLSGDIAEYGKRCKNGIDIAVEEINSAGGINGIKVSVLYEDSRGNPKEGVAAINKLVNVDKVKFIVGAVASSVTLAIEPIATKNKVILFSPASSSPKLTGISQYFFRDWPSDIFEAKVLADFAKSKLQLSDISVLYVNNDYGIGLKDEFVKEFSRLGGKTPVLEAYQQGATDFRTSLSKIKAANSSAIYLAGYHKEMAIATKQIRELGLTAQILGDADYGVDELLKIAGDAAEGAIFSIPEYDPKSGNKSVTEFGERFRKKYAAEPTNFEANGYDAVTIICKAVAAVGMDTDKVSEYIASLKHYQGASGDISFDEKREVVKPVSIKIVKDKQFIIHAKSL